MNIKILSIGKFKNTVFAEIYDLYHKRLKYNLELIELELKKSHNLKIDEIIKKEADLILSTLKTINNPFVVALDENGKQLTSIDFADFIKERALNSTNNLVFIIGGANGLDQKIFQFTDFKLSLGKMTLPHMMVRSVLIEQIYRAQTIINNHPYHKN